MRIRLVGWLYHSPVATDNAASALDGQKVRRVAASDSSGAAVSPRVGWEVDNGYGLVVIDREPLCPSRRVLIVPEDRT